MPSADPAADPRTIDLARWPLQPQRCSFVLAALIALTAAQAGIGSSVAVEASAARVAALIEDLIDGFA